MYFSPSISKRIVLAPLLAVVAIQLLLIRNISSLNMTNAYLNHKCYVDQGIYKPGGVYEENLNSIIHSMSSTGNFRRGYEMKTLNRGSNFVSLILQCRGDSYGPKCRSCYVTTLSELRRRCPKYKGGVIWYDQCLLEISGIDNVHKNDYDNIFCMSNAKDVSGDKDAFHLDWMKFLDNLTGIAISKRNMVGGEVALYAAGERRFRTKKVYGMVQCSKDLSTKGCQVCVGNLDVQFQDCWYAKQGARVLGTNCNFRYEFYPFVNNKAGPKYLETKAI